MTCPNCESEWDTWQGKKRVCSFCGHVVNYAHYTPYKVVEEPVKVEKSKKDKLLDTLKSLEAKKIGLEEGIKTRPELQAVLDRVIENIKDVNKKIGELE